VDSEDEDDDPKPEELPIYRKGKEIFDMVDKVADLISENNEYLMEVDRTPVSRTFSHSEKWLQHFSLNQQD
jgi:hypothetical protein